MKEKKDKIQTAIAKYKATHTYFSVYLDEVEDAQLITWLERQGNKSEAIRRALREMRSPAVWVHDGSNWKNRFLCSNCNYQIFHPAEDYKYCPNCGAHMSTKQEALP